MRRGEGNTIGKRFIEMYISILFEPTDGRYGGRALEVAGDSDEKNFLLILYFSPLTIDIPLNA
jgi:hypothetical protein